MAGGSTSGLRVPCDCGCKGNVHPKTVVRHRGGKARLAIRASLLAQAGSTVTDWSLPEADRGRSDSRGAKRARIAPLERARLLAGTAPVPAASVEERPLAGGHLPPRTPASLSNCEATATGDPEAAVAAPAVGGHNQEEEPRLDGGMMELDGDERIHGMSAHYPVPR